MVDDSLNETANLPAPPDDPGQFILYQTEDGRTRVEVRLFHETVWLSQKAMVELFQKDVRAISEHIRNVFSAGELHEPASSTTLCTITITSTKRSRRPSVTSQDKKIALVGRTQWLP